MADKKPLQGVKHQIRHGMRSLSTRQKTHRWKLLTKDGQKFHREMEFLETLQFQMDFFEENSGGNFKFIKHKWKQNDQKLCNNGQMDKNRQRRIRKNGHTMGKIMNKCVKIGVKCGKYANMGKIRKHGRK